MPLLIPNKMKTEPFSISKRLKSFVYAFAGLKTLLRSEHNAWIHFAATLVVISAGFFLKVNTQEWCLLVFAIGIVFVAELFNTAIEQLTDMISPEYNEKAKKVKDLAAAGVLVAAVVAVVIGCLVFFPYLLK